MGEMSGQWEVVIVGGGPAGCATAMRLKQLAPQARILLLERGRYPRHKVCGEFVSSEGVEALLRLWAGISPLLKDCPQIERGRIFAEGNEARLPLPRKALSIPRYQLDDALWSACCEMGVESSDRCAVAQIEGNGPFAVSTDREIVRARVVVDASGRWSNLSRHNSSNREKWLGVKAHFREPRPNGSVDLYFFEGGYCGVQHVADDAVNACAMVRNDRATSIQDVLRLNSALKRRSAIWEPITEEVTTAPLIFEDPRPWRDGIFRVGDAAGFIDPFVGDGITLALLSGELTAESIARVMNDGIALESAGQEYAAAYESRMAPLFKRTSWLRRLMRAPRLARAAAMWAMQFEPLVRYMVAGTRAA
jgi:menaquinone-9 beta-reductase